MIFLLISSLRSWQITASLSVSVFFKWSCHCPLASGALPKWRRQPSGGTAWMGSEPAVSLENAPPCRCDPGTRAARTTPASLAALAGWVLQPHLATERKPTSLMARPHHWSSWDRAGDPSQHGYLNHEAPLSRVGEERNEDFDLFNCASESENLDSLKSFLCELLHVSSSTPPPLFSSF